MSTQVLIKLSLPAPTALPMFATVHFAFEFSLCLKRFNTVLIIVVLANYPFNFERKNRFSVAILNFSTILKVDFLNLYFLLIITFKLENCRLEF